MFLFCCIPDLLSSEAPLVQKAGFLTRGFLLYSALYPSFSPSGNGSYWISLPAYSDRIVQAFHLIPFSARMGQHFLNAFFNC